VRLTEWDAGGGVVAVSLSETVKVPPVELIVSIPVCAVLSGWALTWPVTLWPLDSVIGREPGAPKNALFEKDTLVMVTDRGLVTVMVSGWDETLPLEPLKLSAVVDRAILLLEVLC
jgi:hypothetical protein